MVPKPTPQGGRVMASLRSLVLGSAAVVSLSLCAVACGGTPPAPPKTPEPPVAEAPPPPAPKAEAPVAANPNTAVNLSDDILRACAIVDNSDRAPKFDF